MSPAAPRQFNGDFNTDFLSIDQLTADDFWLISEEANAMKTMARDEGIRPVLQGSLHYLVFWDSDSTRTKESFRVAITRLGGEEKDFHHESSSKGKGESFERTIETLDTYLVPERDSLIIRHNLAGMVAVAAGLAEAKVINAGDGPNEHPTQATLDVKTVVDYAPDLAEVHIAFFGDLARARTVNSTALLLAKLGVRRMSFVAPVDEMRSRAELLSTLRYMGVEITETDDLREVARLAHFIYATRTQYNLMPSEERQAARARLTGLGKITMKMIEGSGAKLMHPRPEDENDPNFDKDVRQDPRYIVGQQSTNGLWTRMALLALQSGKSITGQV